MQTVSARAEARVDGLGWPPYGGGIDASPADEDALRTLSASYAAGVDRRDRDLLISAFLPDARLQVHDTTRGVLDPMLGHEGIGLIVERIAVYTRTFHLLGQSRFTIGPEFATGETYCVAHHYDDRGERPSDRILYIRYDDTYRCDADACWRIAVRDVRVDWAETREL